MQRRFIVEPPANGCPDKATVIVLGPDGSILAHAITRLDAPEHRQQAARRLAEQLGSNPEQLALDIETQWTRATAGSDPTPGNSTSPAFALDLIDSAAFDDADCSLEWIVEDVLVANQPGIFGGGKKALKTLLGVDLAVSVSAARKFLDTFYVPERRRVVMLSGESGQAVLQDAARRIAGAKGLELRDCDILWGFTLPQLSNVDHLNVLREALDKHKVRLLLFDPLYLAMLSGETAQNLSASNLYHIGPLLLGVARACLDVGCTPVLFHHFKITRANPYGEPQLEDLAYAGVQEFARQWILLGRRCPFDPEDPDGTHELWLNAGGSAGHSILKAVTVREGKLDRQFRGKRWEVCVLSPTDARTANSVEHLREKARQDTAQEKADDAKVLQALDQMDPDRKGMVFTHLRAAAKLNGDRTHRACWRLARDRIIEEVPGKVTAGNGAKKPAVKYRRRQLAEDADIIGTTLSPDDSPDDDHREGLPL